MTSETRQHVQINRARLTELLSAELKQFSQTHPKSKELFDRAKKSMLGGVPMNWMVRWAGAYPLFVQEASGARFTDVDGNEYVDLCLGDTGAMSGHSPAATVRAVEDRSKKGITAMLPTEDGIWVAEELKRRFGLPYWQFALTATDANRFSLRIARSVTKRAKVIVFNYCYHGTVDEAFATLRDGRTVARSSNLGPAVDLSQTTRVVEFNDLDALKKALAHGDVACVLAEPVMTNIGIIHPQPGYWEQATQMIDEAGALLIIDETHTLSASPKGYARANGIVADIVTMGKPIGGGIPSAAYGLSDEVAEKLSNALSLDDCDVSGIGGTLAGNALSLAAMRATLSEVLTDDAYHHMIMRANQWTEGVLLAIHRHQLPWTVQKLGCRAEYWFCPDPPINGAQAAAASDPELDRYMHLSALNRGILLTPFHNMALMCPDTTAKQIDRHTRVFNETVQALVSL